ncbi:iron-sulfur cluster assembly accessory protein [Diplocarpon rosae]|nr:iron-sulfur cluster assembly accessory protein [Diplocarpon rosae]
MASRCIARSCSQIVISSPSSAARAFLKLAPHRQLNNSFPVLEFLAPSALSVAQRSGREHTRLSPSAKRTFACSSSRRATNAIFNPRKDDDGAPMEVEITPRASNRLKQIMSKESNPNLALRIQVESGGCHGFQYLMSLTTIPPFATTPGAHQEEASPAPNTSSDDSNEMTSRMPSPTLPESGEETGKLDEDDTIFAADDGSGAKVVMDGPSLELLKGSKVDYTMELIGSQFKIVDNPLATSSCGCGTSFDIKP